MELPEHEKVNHFVNNIVMVSRLWGDFLKLHEKVQQVKDDVNFKTFCISIFDKWNIKIDHVKEFFI